MSGISNINKNCYLIGRWSSISENPKVIFDAAHNLAGFKIISSQLKKVTYNKLHVILGFVKGKNIKELIAELPAASNVYYTSLKMERGMTLNEIRRNVGGNIIFDDNTKRLIEVVKMDCTDKDLILITGSNFIAKIFMKNKLLFLLLIFQSSIIYSQIISDRPSQTDSPLVIGENYIQIETGILIEEIKSDINTLIRIGIFDGFELRINGNYIISEEISFQKNSSFNDFQIGSKFRILENDENNTNIGFLTYISIPTASEAFSFNEYGFLNKLLFSHNLTSDSEIGYNIGYDKFINYDGLFTYSLIYGKTLGSFSTFFELFGNSSSNSSNLNFDSGLTYLIDDDSQFDITIGKGLNNDLFFVNLGFSFRIY